MTQYSGKMTGHTPIGEPKLVAELIQKDCIRQQTVFDVQWSNCPIEVADEVEDLWRDNNLGNDNYFYQWDSESETYDKVSDEDVLTKDKYPLIHEYLSSRGITECWIYYWW